ncbi:MAG: fimbrillin family protein [Methanocorpusculum sp.]|nr:fimbrillin family protein [Methanocorpusculum sp.]
MQIKTLKLFVAAAALLSLSACNNDENLTDPFADGPVAMTFTADINSVATRATTTGFQEGDVVGIIPWKANQSGTQTVETAQANIAYTYGSDGKFKAALPYYFQDRKEVTFNAYYPQDNITVTQDNYVLEINTDALNQIVLKMDDQRSWRKNDYLFATAGTTVETPTISFIGVNAFTHVMSSVAIKFTAGTDKGVADLNLLTEYTLGNIVMKGTFDCSTGKTALTPDEDPQSITMKDLQPGKETEYTTDPLILLPQDVEGGEFPLTVKYNGVDYKATLKLAELAAGTYYEFPVTIKNTGLEIGSAEIKGWESGTATGGDATLQ